MKTLLDPLDVMAKMRDRAARAVAVGRDPAAYRTGAELLLRPVGIPFPEDVPGLEAARWMLAGMEHVVGFVQVHRARALAGDDAAKMADATRLFRAGWTVNDAGQWTMPELPGSGATILITFFVKAVAAAAARRVDPRRPGAPARRVRR